MKSLSSSVAGSNGHSVGIYRILRGLALSALSIFCFAVLALGQDATVVGTVTDPTGSVVPKATISITSINTGQTRTLTTNESGQYVAPDTRDANGSFRDHRTCR